MAETGSIDRAYSIALDLVRGCAALVVLIGHMVQFGMYSGPYPLGPTAQHYAVMVFFVLSGFVVTHSTRTRRGSLRDYAIARGARIVPVAWLALLVGTACFGVAEMAGITTTLELPKNKEITLTALLLPVVFLSEVPFGEGPVWNPPYWSLAYEVWFYILFAAAWFLRGPRRVFWVVLLALAAGPRVLLLLPIWLFGSWLAVQRLERVSFPLALACLSFGVSLCAWAAINEDWGLDLLMQVTGKSQEFLRFSERAITDIVYGVGVTACFIALAPLSRTVEPLLARIEKPVRWLAACSFSLYILHWPIVSLLVAMDLRAGDSPIIFALIVLALIGLAHFFALKTEYRTAEVRAWIRKRLPEVSGIGNEKGDPKAAHS